MDAANGSTTSACRHLGEREPFRRQIAPLLALSEPKDGRRAKPRTIEKAAHRSPPGRRQI